MFDYVYTMLVRVKMYMLEDRMNSLEVQSVAMQVLGVILLFGAYEINNYGILAIVGSLLIILGWLGGLVIMAVDDAVLKIYYMINPEEGNEVAVQGTKNEDKEDEDNETTIK